MADCCVSAINHELSSSAAKRDSRIYLNRDLRIKKLLHKSKFPLLLVYSEDRNQYYAAKVFPYKNQEINSHFLRELPISSLAHPNIITFNEAQSLKKGLLNKPDLQFSYILMEYAPYQDFIHVLNQGKIYEDEKLVRTFFHHLIDGLEYLHSMNYAHMDLKLDNLLLDEEFRLKLADFDCCCYTREREIMHRGTRDYRALEVIEEKCKDPKAADMYSVGVILFLLYTGFAPYFEDKTVGDQDYDLFDILTNNPRKYFKSLSKCHNYKISFDTHFKKLFLSLTSKDPSKRLSTKEVKENKWYQKPIYDARELQIIMSKRVKPVSTDY